MLRHRRSEDPWWRIGLVGVVMMMLLGTAVWECNPGAATRVLLPMGLAFTVLAVRQRAAWPWLLAGCLSVFSGVLALWHVPQDPRELGAGRFDHGTYVVRLESGWYGRERDADDVWAWNAGQGDIAVETWPRQGAPLRVGLGLRALAPRRVEIRQETAVLWSGTVGTEMQWIYFGTRSEGRAVLRIVTSEAPVLENGAPGARALGIAVYDPRLE